MERYEVLKLIRENITTIVPELEKIKEKVKPAFEKKGWDFDLGVDVVGSVAEGKLNYGILVLESGLELELSEVVEVVRMADSKIDCLVGIHSGHNSYPASNSLVNLNFLQDWQKMLGE